MDKEELRHSFDEHAAGYDKQWEKMAPIRDALHFLLQSQFAELSGNAVILSVGTGTGFELAFLAQRFTHWKFVVVEPSGRMLDVCRRRAESEGFASRCEFHEGYLDSLPFDEKYDAATSFLVSQFILEPKSRSEFFHEIASRLKPGGLLASSDLAAEVDSLEYEALLKPWMNMMATADISPDGLEKMRRAYANDVAVVSPETVASIIKTAGFESVIQFFQAGLIHAWISKTSLLGA